MERMNVRQRLHKINTKPKPSRKTIYAEVNLHFKVRTLEKRLDKGPRPDLKDVVESGRDVVPEDNVLA